MIDAIDIIDFIVSETEKYGECFICREKGKRYAPSADSFSHPKNEVDVGNRAGRVRRSMLRHIKSAHTDDLIEVMKMPLVEVE